MLALSVQIKLSLQDDVNIIALSLARMPRHLPEECCILKVFAENEKGKLKFCLKLLSLIFLHLPFCLNSRCHLGSCTSTLKFYTI